MSQHFIIRFIGIYDLISKKATDTPSQLAIRLSISESILYESLNLMKELGTSFHCNNGRNVYCYNEIGRFIIDFVKGDEKFSAPVSSDCETILLFYQAIKFIY
jgi:hypothetical protein